MKHLFKILVIVQTGEAETLTVYEHEWRHEGEFAPIKIKAVGRL